MHTIYRITPIDLAIQFESRHDVSMKNTSIINSLNGIRGFAILLVLLSHASNAQVNLHSNLNFSGTGLYGVFLFFTLSAFLLTRQFLEYAPKGDQIKPFIAHYLTRRFLRIYPLFTASLLLYYLLDKFGVVIYNITEIDLIKTIFLLDGKGIFWTIPVEFQYYFLLPIVSLLLLSAGNAILVVIAISLFVAAWGLLFPQANVKHLIPYLPIFVLGSGAAFISNKIGGVKHKHILNGFNFFAASSFLAFFILTPYYFNYIFSQHVGRTEFHEQFLMFSILSCTLVLSVVHSNGLIKKLMESRFLVFWGNVSFSAYLLHMIVLKFVKLLAIPAPAQWLLFISITASVSFLFFKYFEMPLSKIHNIKSLYERIITATGLATKSK